MILGDRLPEEESFHCMPPINSLIRGTFIFIQISNKGTIDPVVVPLRTIAIVTPLLFFSDASIMLQNQRGWGYTHISLTHYKKEQKQQSNS